MIENWDDMRMKQNDMIQSHREGNNIHVINLILNK